jgi:hypothetical protein
LSISRNMRYATPGKGYIRLIIQNKSRRGNSTGAHRKARASGAG